MKIGSLIRSLEAWKKIQGTSPRQKTLGTNFWGKKSERIRQKTDVTMPNKSEALNTNSLQKKTYIGTFGIPFFTPENLGKKWMHDKEKEIDTEWLQTFGAKSSIRNRVHQHVLSDNQRLLAMERTSCIPLTTLPASSCMPLKVNLEQAV